jgi:hypothetical protein
MNHASARVNVDLTGLGNGPSEEHVLGRSTAELANGTKANGASHAPFGDRLQAVSQLSPHEGDCAGVRGSVTRGSLRRTSPWRDSKRWR